MACDIIARALALIAKRKASKVIANPDLEGNEDALTGIEVDGTKFKVEQPAKLYAHYICLYYYRTSSPYDRFVGSVTIINTSGENMSVSAIWSYFRGITDLSSRFGVDGQFAYRSAERVYHPVTFLIPTSTSNQYAIGYIDSDSSENSVNLTLQKNNEKIVALN